MKGREEIEIFCTSIDSRFEGVPWDCDFLSNENPHDPTEDLIQPPRELLLQFSLIALLKLLPGEGKIHTV